MLWQFNLYTLFCRELSKFASTVRWSECSSLFFHKTDLLAFILHVIKVTFEIASVPAPSNIIGFGN
jgi:hypothetical protein